MPVSSRAQFLQQLGWDPVSKTLIDPTSDKILGSFGPSTGKYGSKGITYFDGRFGDFDISATRTFELTMEIPFEFDMVHPIIGAGRAAASPVSPAGCQWWFCQPPSFDNTDLDNALWTQGYSNAASPATTFTLTAAAAVDRKAYVDTVPAALGAHVARTDGGAFPLVSVRAVIALTAGNINVMGDGDDSFASWDVPRSDARRRKSRISSGNHASTAQTTFTANEVTNTWQNPICGMIFYLRGKVINIMITGDSIDSGRGTCYGEGWAIPMANLVQQATGLPVCVSQLAVSAATSAVARDSIEDFCITYGQIPDLIFVDGGSVNDLNTPATAANVNTAQNRLAGALKNISSISRYVPRVLRTIMPTTTQTKVFGTSDIFRQGLNTATLARTGEVVFDAAAVPTTSVVNGQIVMPISDTSSVDTGSPDGIHPNDALNAKLSIPAAIAAVNALSISLTGV